MATIRKKIEIETKYGNCNFVTFYGLDGQEHFAIIFKNANTQNCPLVRVHSECITGDVFGSLRCDCGDQLSEAMNLFSKSGGILLYLRQEGRGIGLYNKLDAYVLQDKGFDTFEANRMLNFPEDMRRFDVAADMLKALGTHEIDLLSNNPDKYIQLKRCGIQIHRIINTGFYVNKRNKKYLQAKIEKSNHSFTQNIVHG